MAGIDLGFGLIVTLWENGGQSSSKSFTRSQNKDFKYLGCASSFTDFPIFPSVDNAMNTTLEKCVKDGAAEDGAAVNALYA